MDSTMGYKQARERLELTVWYWIRAEDISMFSLIETNKEREIKGDMCYTGFCAPVCPCSVS